MNDTTYDFTELQNVINSWSEFNVPEPIATFSENNITCIAGGVEMLKVAQDGFYVRGVKVPADDKEAETVYNAFKSFLMWAELHRE